MSKVSKIILNFYKKIGSDVELLDNGIIRFELTPPEITMEEFLSEIENRFDLKKESEFLLEDLIEKFESAGPAVISGNVVVQPLEEPHSLAIITTIELPLEIPPSFRIEVMKFISLANSRLNWAFLSYIEKLDKIKCRCSTYGTEKTINEEMLSEIISGIMATISVSTHGLSKILDDMDDAETAIRHFDYYLHNENQELIEIED